MERRWHTISIVGVGLIGGSIGLALRRRGLAEKVIGWGRSEDRLKSAQRLGAIHEGTTNLSIAVRSADIVVVCTPVDRIIEDVLACLEYCREGAAITDAGSAKAKIVEQVEGELRDSNARGKSNGGIHFVGAHPMAGSEKAGVENACENLFDRCNVFLTPTDATAPSALKTVYEFWRSFDANVHCVSPQRHDEIVAYISHLPHIAAAAAAGATPDDFLPFAASGWRGATRIASGDAELWKQILSQNRDEVLRATDELAMVITQFRTALAANDDTQLLQLLVNGKAKRDALGN